jgi:Glycosyltransferase family 87
MRSSTFSGSRRGREMSWHVGHSLEVVGRSRHGALVNGPAPGGAEAGRRWIVALQNVLLVYALVVLPLLVTGYRLLDAWRTGNFAVDFEQTLLPAAEAVASGDSPYPAFGYPPLTAFMLVPVTVVPAADVVFTCLLAATVPLSLWLFGIRDWRCYGAAFAWAPVFHALQTANVTILLLLGAAACWRYRDRPIVLGWAGGLAIAVKGICWPLAVWALAMRRVVGGVVMIAVCGLVTFGLWATLGFSGLADYPSSVEGLEGAVWRETYTVRALAVDLGVPDPAAFLLSTALAIGALAACVYFGLQRDDRRSYSFAALAIVIASPIVWLHSFALLLAPLAVLRPRFSPLWLLPALLWVASGTGNGTTWQTALVISVGAAVFAAAVVFPSSDSSDDRDDSGWRRQETLYSSSKIGLSTKPSL